MFETIPEDRKLEPAWFIYVQTGILATLAILSVYFFFFHFFRRDSIDRGHIALSDTPTPSTRLEALNQKLLDNLDDLPDDDGEFVEEDKFWRRVIPLRCIDFALALVLFAVQAAHSYPKIHQDSTKWTILVFGIFTFTTAIQTILCTAYILNTKITTHTYLTYHIFTLCALHLSAFGFAIFGQYLTNSANRIPSHIEYGLVGLLFLLTLIISTIPCEPLRRSDLSIIYTDAVAAVIHTQETEMNDISQGGGSSIANMHSQYSACILSRLSLSWIIPVLRKIAASDQIDVQDLPGLSHLLRTQTAVRQAMGNTLRGSDRDKGKRTMMFLREIWFPQWRTVIPGMALAFCSVPLWYIPHYALQQVLVSLESGSGRRSATAWAVILVSSRLGKALLEKIEINLTRTYSQIRMGAHARYILYSKVLIRNIFARYNGDQKTGDHQPKIDAKKTSSADELNLLTKDVDAIARIGFTLVQLIRCQLELLLGASYVWILLGPSGMWGLSTLLITSGPAYLLTKLQYKLYEKQLAISDQKLTLMQEAIQAISMIKITNAQEFWYNRIKNVRDLEFRRLLQARILGFISGILYSASPTIIVVVAFAHYALIAQKPLSAAVAFTSIAVFEQLRPVLHGLPEEIAKLLMEHLSAKRIANLLASDDVQYLLESPIDKSGTTDKPLHIRGTIAWYNDFNDSTQHITGFDAGRDVECPQNQIQQSFKLQNIDVTFPLGQITLIAGKFGSGKTLMLLAMLGEAHLLHGSITYCASEIQSMSGTQEGTESDWSLLPLGTAYVPQTAWLQSQSIRENILFGLPLDEGRYRSVLFAVGLLPDLELLEDSDLTEIGERGKILSGGQKARVSLARAVYSRASTILLDDVISAVDAQTSTHIIKYCFRGPLMQGRTIIVVSHAVEALAPIAHQAIFLEDGHVVWSGTGIDLLRSEYMSHLRAVPSTLPKENSDTSVTQNSGQIIQHLAGNLETTSNIEGFEIRQALNRTPRQLIIEETRSTGDIQTAYWWEVIWFNGGVFFWIGLGLLLLANCLLPVGERRVLEMWTHESGQPGQSISKVVFWVGLYSGLSAATIIAGSLFGVCRFLGGLRATRRVHSEMLSTVLCAKMTFFTRTRAGSIMQRFGADLTDVLSCSEGIGEIAQNLLNIIVALLSVSIYGGWTFVITTALAAGCLYKPFQWFRSASLQNRRLDSVLPGPVNSIYAETIAGATVIRAFGLQSLKVNQLLCTLNLQVTTWGWRMYIARCLEIQLLDITIIASALYLILATENMSAASAGFILAFAGTISADAAWLMVFVRNFELAAVSLERTSEYRHLEKEDPDQRLDLRKDQENLELVKYRDWPKTGQIEVINLSARYGPDMPKILHQVSFSVGSGERVGIVGPTGSGKSTLSKAFFNFVDITEGQIIIDKEDIADIPLGKVRSELGIIAQDPILLSGTLRLNLDIEGRYSDDQLYDALHQVQLIRKFRVDVSNSEMASSSDSDFTAVSNIFEDLDYEIASRGDNLSAGQKQLVVLARALLRKQKILIMDEATASIDSETDAEISRVVYQKFEGATILIIAHRLRTIIPCSTILVMDNGHLVQSGSAYDLIRQKGKFKELCMAAGMAEYEALLSMTAMQPDKNQLVDI